MEITQKDVYQMLIAECRYGYTRNNHLMPGGAYAHVKKYLDKMDSDMAVATAKQLCEECIELELNQFSDGLDDEFDNRQNAVEFIDYLLEYINEYTTQYWNEELKSYIGDWKPYNYQQYLNNKALDNLPVYNIYEGNYLNDKETIADIIQTSPINDEKQSKLTVLVYLFDNILNLSITTHKKYDIDKYTTKFIFDNLKKVYYIRREQE